MRLTAVALLSLLSLALSAQTANPLTALLALDEPGAQRRGLEAYLVRHPDDPQRAVIYTTLIEDATALNDDAGVLRYNEKLEELDPTDLGQRIKTLNLLLVSTAPADRALAARQAAVFAEMVEAKAKENPPAEMGPTRWRLNIARLRSLADLFTGAAAQAKGKYAEAEAALGASLQQSESEEAAEHLAQVYVAEDKIPQAIDTFALALALPGQTIAGRARLRAQAGGLWRQTHGGSESGFGDLILRKFDAVAARDAAEQDELDRAGHAEDNRKAASADGFVLHDLKGDRHTLAELRGQVVVVDFWATWCGPCKVQHPLLVQAAQTFAQDHRVSFISINEDEETAKVAPFIATQHWAPTTWLDAGLGPFLGVESLPTTLILGPSGQEEYRQEGFVPDTFAIELEQAVRSALARAFSRSPG